VFRLKRYCLPVELRDELRQLHGKLYHGDGIETTKNIIKDLENCAKIISVGDIVTFNLLSAGLIPDISFVDNRTKRSPVSEKIKQVTKQEHFRTITVESPPGIITEELLQEIQMAMESNEPIQLIVNGEEDLAALPAIAMSPISSVIIYGLPDKGAVVVRVTKSKKKEIQSLLNRMKCKEKK
jgi:GTP-dependent dephospho-CoA kinase